MEKTIEERVKEFVSDALLVILFGSVLWVPFGVFIGKHYYDYVNRACYESLIKEVSVSKIVSRSRVGHNIQNDLVIEFKNGEIHYEEKGANLAKYIRVGRLADCELIYK